MRQCEYRNSGFGGALKGSNGYEGQFTKLLNPPTKEPDGGGGVLDHSPQKRALGLGGYVSAALSLVLELDPLRMHVCPETLRYSIL